MFKNPYPQSNYNNSYFHNYYSQPNHPAMNYKYTTAAQTPYEIFSKPKQPANWYPYSGPGMAYKPPKNTNLMYYFQDTNGELDINKMVSTVGQAATLVQQLSPIVKQVNSMMKQFK